MLECFKTVPHPPRIVPGQVGRRWMDDHHARFPYNCLPLNMANTSGWELLSPFGFSATWDGGMGADAIELEVDGDVQSSEGATGEPAAFAESHFSHGILTFNLGYLFRTSPGHDILVGGVPNHFKHGIQPMSGIIEAHWLPYPFTMNWLFTAPGTVRFECDEPFAFIQIVEHRAMDAIQPTIFEIGQDAELAAHQAAWLLAREEAAPGQHRCYIRGRPPAGGGPAPEDHITKRRLKCPVAGDLP